MISEKNKLPLKNISCKLFSPSMFPFNPLFLVAPKKPSRKLAGENPDWTEDRKNYDQVSPLHENLRKSMSKTTTKVRPNYDQGGQNCFLKS